MTDNEIVDRLAALPKLGGVPRDELAWLVAHSHFEEREAGSIVGAEGEPIENLWIVLSGEIVIRVDRGAGPRQVMRWRSGDVTGMLPYSRMTGPPGDNRVEEHCELLGVPVEHFPELIHHCPTFTAHTVHLMLDRARSFNASDLHDEKMVSLGKLAAGLAHELDNPASVMIRAAKLLVESVEEADAASRAMGAVHLADDVVRTIEQVRLHCLAQDGATGLSPLDRADLEEAIVEWLGRHDLDPGQAAPLVDGGLTLESLERLRTEVPEGGLAAVLGWVASGCTMHSLAHSIEQSATRAHDLVATIKRFTYMDHLAGPELVDVETGLRDTIGVMEPKAKAKGVTIEFDGDGALPHVQANGGELNQIWANLLDNAIDAVEDDGRIEISACVELDRVVVRVVDDGPGIPEEVLHRIFDPFFTTKPPGKGTGLGLDITRRLVRRYHGDITVQSRPGRTEFKVELILDSPRAAADA